MAKAARKVARKGRESVRLQEIKVAASRLFVGQGYDRTSMQDIANAVGLTKPGLYHSVESKEDLLRLILDDGLARTEQGVLEPARAVKDPQERLAALIRLQIRNISRIESESGNPITAVVESLVGLGPESRDAVRTRLRQVFDLYRTTLDELKASGRLAPDLDTTVAAFSIIGMVIWTNRWRRPGGRLSSEEVAENLVNLALHGVLG